MKNDKLINSLLSNKKHRKNIRKQQRKKALLSIKKLKYELVKAMQYLKLEKQLINDNDIKDIIDNIYNEIGISKNNDLLSEVNDMLARARRNKKPKVKYIPQHHKSVLTFLEETYGKYIKYFGAKEDLIFLNHLGLIHPNKYKNRRVLDRIKNIEKNGESRPLSEVEVEKLKFLQKQKQIFQSSTYEEKFGGDVRQALINHCRRNNLKLTDIIKTANNV